MHALVEQLQEVVDALEAEYRANGTSRLYGGLWDHAGAVERELATFTPKAHDIRLQMTLTAARA